jgi:hypothetical protein
MWPDPEIDRRKTLVFNVNKIVIKINCWLCFNEKTRGLHVDFHLGRGKTVSIPELDEINENIQEMLSFVS